MGFNHLQTRWVGKNVDLNILGECVRNFFVGKGFSTTEVKTEEGIEILCTYGKGNRGRCVKIAVKGSPDDFSVNFETPIGDERPLKFFSPFLTLTGLGLFWSKKIKVYEFYKGLEEEFWTYLDKVVSEITVSSKNKQGYYKKRK